MLKLKPRQRTLMRQRRILYNGKENHIYDLRNISHGPQELKDNLSFCFNFLSSTLAKKKKNLKDLKIE